jgi:hypothetical protein
VAIQPTVTPPQPTQDSSRIVAHSEVIFRTNLPGGKLESCQNVQRLRIKGLAARISPEKFSSRKAACHVRLCSAQMFCVSGIAAAAARVDYCVGSAKYGHQKFETDAHVQDPKEISHNCQ